MTLFDFTKNLQNKTTQENITFNYSDSKAVDIFTYAQIPDASQRLRANQKLHRMIALIKEMYIKSAQPPMQQILVHYHACDACKRSRPLFQNLAKELQRNLQFYTWFEIEMEEVKSWAGGKISGYDLYKLFKATGVPFIVQNFIVTENTFKNEVRRLFKRTDWNVAYKGEVHPFDFLASTFHIKNELLENAKPKPKF